MVEVVLYFVYMVWLKFLLCLIIILFAGTKLARYGDIIAEKTGLGRMWIGLVLLAFVTSMPEMVTGVSSAALVKIPDLALGTFFGSCLFNLSILAILDILHRNTPILSKASLSHIASAGLGILLLAVASGGILAGDRFPGLSLGWVGVPGIIVLILYLVGTRQMFRFERRQQVAQPQPEVYLYRDVSARSAIGRFALAAIAVIGTGIWLSFVGDEIAQTTGWDTSFVGSLFLAITTSMPELAVTIAAVRLGAIDMAVADILGANMLDCVAIIVADLFYTQGSILADVSSTHLITAAVVFIMYLLVIAGLSFRHRRKTFGVISWYGPLLFGLYILGAYFLFIQA